MDPAQLPIRDFHLPPPVGWWPPAVGWWLLLLLISVVAVIGFWAWRRSKRKSIKKLAKSELARLRQDSELSELDRIKQLSVLLRRIAISAFPRVDSASLTGSAWLEFLDRPMSKKRFSEGPGKVLVEAPYRSGIQVDFDGLFELCEAWIMALPEGTAKKNASDLSTP